MPDEFATPTLDGRLSPLLAAVVPAAKLAAPHAHKVDLRAVEVQAVRLLLGGGSVVDWRRLHFRNRDAVVRFLAVNGFDPSDPSEVARLTDLHRRAVEYVEQTFAIDIPPRVRPAAGEGSQSDPCTLFLAASSDNRWEQRAACVVLKLMHVINHLEARRLIHHLSFSERALFRAASRKVDAAVDAMRASGLDIVRYEPSTKSEHSLVTKLLSKPRVTAAQIFDKLRFRLVTRDREDLIPTLLWLTRHLFPFNHVIAGESHNTILTPTEVAQSLEARLETPVAPWTDPAAGGAPDPNPATSSSFRMINFVVELPVRVRAVCAPQQRQHLAHLGHLLLVTLEFQIFDQQTAAANERGEGNHAAYKGRQLGVVARRLWGERPPAVKVADS